MKLSYEKILRKVFSDFLVKWFMNDKIIILIAIAGALLIGIIIVVLVPTQNETVEEETSRAVETDQIKSVLKKIEDEKISNDNSEKPYIPKEREWIESGPFKIDRSEYVLGEKIFINMDDIDKNTKGAMVFAKQINSTYYYEYKKIKFDGSKQQNNFYLGFNLNPVRGICSVDKLIGDWIVIFEGTNFESLKFKVKDQIIPGMEKNYEPVC